MKRLSSENSPTPQIPQIEEGSMHKLLTDAVGKGVLMLRSEAIARGGIEAGVGLASC